MSTHFDWAREALRTVLARFKETTSRRAPLPGLTETTVGNSRMNMLSEASAPGMYWHHLESMTHSAGRILDKQGEPQLTLPRGLIVNRVLPTVGAEAGTTSRGLRASFRARGLTTRAGISPPTASTPTLLAIQPETVGKRDSDAEGTGSQSSMSLAVPALEVGLDVHPSRPAHVSERNASQTSAANLSETDGSILPTESERKPPSPLASTFGWPARARTNSGLSTSAEVEDPSTPLASAPSTTWV